ncbi:MAG: DUF1801 domain-containing protein [Terracidiphilus sp.]|jgi:uncharacterized protein YdhG (YjbR/CyaY superfamily)
MTHEFKSVDEYIAAQPEAAQRALKRVRNTIRKAVPRAEETISYKMPTYKLDGERLMYFAGWKQHYSIYPATKKLLAALKDDLREHDVVKSTVRFPLDKPVPVRLIAKMAKFRARELAKPGKSGKERGA